MKNMTMTLILASCSTALFAQSAAPAENPCLAKQHEIQNQIRHAKARGEERKLAGLNKALQENKANCTPESLRREHERDVSQAREKVVERENELNKAKADGKDKKTIAKRERKLLEANAELHKAEKALNGR